MKLRNKRAFTLVELLTVIAIMGILAGFLFPTLRKARAKAKMAKCANNLLQFVHAIDLFKMENDDYPDFLSNLYPSYISSKEMYLCPADYCTQGNYSHRGADGGVPWWMNDRREFSETDDTDSSAYDNLRNSEEARKSNDQRLMIQYCSYFYEFCGAPSSLYVGYTWKEKGKERIRAASGFRGPVPIIRCCWHQKQKRDTGKFASGKKELINVAAREKNIYYSDASTERYWK